MNAEEGKKDDCGQKHERKRTISFFILSSGGRIYLLGCTADAPFLWLSFPYVSCQVRVLMKQKDTGSLLLTPPSSFQHSSQCQPRVFLSVPFLLLLFFFTKNKIWDTWDPIWFQLGKSTIYFTAAGYLLPSMAVLSEFHHGSYASTFVNSVSFRSVELKLQYSDTSKL